MRSRQERILAVLGRCRRRFAAVAGVKSQSESVRRAADRHAVPRIALLGGMSDATLRVHCVT